MMGEAWPGGAEPAAAAAFAACQQCPSLEGCQAAEFCVIESRFGRPDRSIAELTCSTCGRGSESAWACLGRSGEPCDAQSPLWGQWFLVRLYANDARAAAELADVGQAAELADVDQAAELADVDRDDWEPCRHDCDDRCYDEYDRPDCQHQHCANCGGCYCPGYCDDYQTYNLRPDETGGAELADVDGPAAPGGDGAAGPLNRAD